MKRFGLAVSMFTLAILMVGVGWGTWLQSAAAKNAGVTNAAVVAKNDDREHAKVFTYMLNRQVGEDSTKTLEDQLNKWLEEQGNRIEIVRVTQSSQQFHSMLVVWYKMKTN